MFSCLVHPSYPSLHTCTFEGIKIGNLDAIFFKGPLQTRLHLGLAPPVHTLIRVAKETRNKDDFMHSKQKNASAPQIFIHYCRLSVSFLSVTGVLKNSLKALHFFFKSGIQLIGSFFLSSGYFSSVFAIISQFMYSKVNITIIATLHLKK